MRMVRVVAPVDTESTVITAAIIAHFLPEPAGLVVNCADPATYTVGGRVPILVRPVREQLEHDRVIRHLQAKLKRKYDVTTNVGDEKNAGVRSGALMLYPDLVLTTGRKMVGVVEVETNESVNHLEAMAQWAHFGRSRLAFHLYVPANAVEMARRLAEEIQVPVSEIWSFHAIGDQIRFALMHRSAGAPPAPAPQAAAKPSAAKLPATKPPATKPPARTAKTGRTPARAAGRAKPSKSRASGRTRPSRGASAAAGVRKSSRAQKRK